MEPRRRQSRDRGSAAGSPDSDPLADLLATIRACRLCAVAPSGAPLPHEPRPVIRARSSARIGVFSQAPGTRVHASGVPFTDPSGERLRAWMAVTAEEFYDEARVAVVPMGFCFPGLDAKGGDLPPRPECAPQWRSRVMDGLASLELVLLVGGYAQRWHVPAASRGGLTKTVAAWREIFESQTRPRYLPLPHPSWRNNGWIKRNPWFARDLLPMLQGEVRRLLTD